jgi:tetratricopeptide (TPR) repeat protein
MRIFLVIILFFSLSAVNADDNLILLEEANKVYNEGSFGQAAELYEKVIENGYHSANLYYNLGNAHFKQNNFSSAILYYEKAKKLEPNNEDINFNLNIANNRIVDKIETVPELFYVRWWNTLSYALTVDQWGLVSIISFVLLLLMALGFLLSHMVWLKKTSFWFGMLFMVIFISTYAQANQKFNSFKEDHEAIVFTPTVTVKSSPTESSIDLFVIHEGTKVEMIDHVGDWYEIIIANGGGGWVRGDDIEKI